MTSFLASGVGVCVIPSVRCYGYGPPVRRYRSTNIYSAEVDRWHLNGRPLAPLQQLRPHHSGSRPRGEQEEEQAHEPKSVTGRFDVRISFFRFPRNFRVYPPPHSSQSTVD